MLASTCLGEECVESIITSTNSFVTGHLTVGLDAVLKAEKFPARIANLNATLANVKT